MVHIPQRQATSEKPILHQPLLTVIQSGDCLDEPPRMQATYAAPMGSGWLLALGGKMTDSPSRRRYARYALATIRMVNGVAGLAAPELLIKRLDNSQEPTPAAIYAFRLFGIRTILLGLDLVVRPEDEQQHLVREGIVIHGTDVLTVALLGVRRQLPPRTAVTVGLISAVNLALALASREPRR
jgi:hypothetical protein